ncbi:MAG: hypothetical protein KQI62_12950 [Deltaproteobacteria bacterium]|nr:hypothetical protein [Deltaproteobacteria bacterium]
MRLSTLKKYVSGVREGIKEYVEKTGAKPNKYKAIKHFPKAFVATEKQRGSTHLTKQIEELDWRPIIGNYLEEEVSNEKTFIGVVDEIYNKNKELINNRVGKDDNTQKVGVWLKNFIAEILVRDFEGGLTDDELIEELHLFLTTIKTGDYKQNVLIFLEGVYLGTNQINFNDTIVLRKSQKKDFVWYEHEGTSLFSPIDFFAVTGSILEINACGKLIVNMMDYIGKYLMVMRLYRLGSVYPKRIKTTQQSPLIGRRMFWSSSSLRHTEKYKYTIVPQAKRNFIKFSKEIVIQYEGWKKNGNQFKIDIALERYYHALLEPLDKERSLMTAVMGLEAILSKSKDRGENAYKLSMRTAKLMGAIGYDPKEVYKTVDYCYGIRNSVVHGRQIKGLKSAVINDNSKKILEYLRLSLVFCMGFTGENSEEHINVIEDSLLNSGSGNSLKAIVDKTNGKMGNTLSNFR